MSKRIHSCTLCDETLFHVEQGHIEPRADAVRVGVAMLDGSRANVTMCSACAAAPDMRRLHEILVAAWMESAAKSGRAIPSKLLAHYRNNVPMGVVIRESWSALFTQAHGAATAALA